MHLLYRHTAQSSAVPFRMPKLGWDYIIHPEKVPELGRGQTVTNKSAPNGAYQSI